MAIGPGGLERGPDASSGDDPVLHPRRGDAAGPPATWRTTRAGSVPSSGPRSLPIAPCMPAWLSASTWWSATPGLLNLGFIAFFGIGSYTYALVASDQLHHHYPLLAALSGRHPGDGGLRIARRGARPAAPRRLPGDRNPRLRPDHARPDPGPGPASCICRSPVRAERPEPDWGHQRDPPGRSIQAALQPAGNWCGAALPEYYWIFLGVLGLFVFCMIRWREHADRPRLGGNP